MTTVKTPFDPNAVSIEDLINRAVKIVLPSVHSASYGSRAYNVLMSRENPLAELGLLRSQTGGSNLDEDLVVNIDDAQTFVFAHGNHEDYLLIKGRAAKLSRALPVEAVIHAFLPWGEPWNDDRRGLVTWARLGSMDFGEFAIFPEDQSDRTPIVYAMARRIGGDDWRMDAQ